MLTIVTTLFGLIVGALSEGEPWFLGAIAGMALGQAFAARSAQRQVKQLTEELQRQGQTLQRVDNGLLWMWNEWQRARARVPAAEPAQPAAATAQAQRDAAAEPVTSKPQPWPPQAVAPPAAVQAVQATVGDGQPPDLGAQPTPQPGHVAPAGAVVQPGPAPTRSAAYYGQVTPSQVLPRDTTATSGPSLEAQVREFFLGGNTIARVGILVLLVGVVLLLKWAADNSLYPIEARMGTAALVGATLVGLGYRARVRRPVFGALLQGGGIAALYLTTFFSFHAYALLPAVLAFALLAGISVSSGALAVAQNSMPLVVVGCLGGFMAPILASTGSGNHVALFSYYLLLNLAILCVAIYKLWWPLSLLGFVFTFGVGSTWGVLKYAPEHFWTTEPYLLAFGLIFAVTPVLIHARARRLDPERRTPILSTSLTFGTPLTVLVLQGLLLRDEPLQMALALVGLGFLYLGGATLLLQRADKSFMAFTEAFLAIGIGFATLAIPYAVSNHGMTAGAWALEGAGMIWVGLRQNRARPRWFGMLLQVAAGVSLLIGYATAGDWPLNSITPATRGVFGASLLAVSCYLSGWYSSKHRQRIPDSWTLNQLLFFWGLAFGLGYGWGTIGEQVPSEYLPGAQLAFVAALALILETASAKLEYDLGRWPPVALFAITPLLVIWFLVAYESSPFEDGMLLAWPLLFAAMLLTSVRWVPTAPAVFGHVLVSLLVSTTALLGVFAVQLCRNIELGRTWGHSAFSAIQALALLGIVALRDVPLWPISRHRSVVVGPGALTLFLLCVGALLIQTTLSGDPSPLSYLPLLNPLDLSHVLAVTACAVYVTRAYPSVRGEKGPLWQLVTAALAFIVLNGVLARAVHHTEGVPYTFDQLWRSPNMQWVLSGAWTIIAMSLIFLSSNRGFRNVWLAASGLMALIVVKLFLVDLSRQSTVAKIVTFLAVGVALLVVGWLSPLPPKRSGADPLPTQPSPLPQNEDPALDKGNPS